MSHHKTRNVCPLLNPDGRSFQSLTYAFDITRNPPAEIWERIRERNQYPPALNVASAFPAYLLTL